MATAGRASEATRSGALALLVVGGAAGGAFLRRASLVEPLTDRPGWRWVDAGSLLYLVAALAAIPAWYVLLDVARLPALLRGAAQLAIIAVPLASAWALQPREGRA